jgi:hypothetical protein
MIPRRLSHARVLVGAFDEIRLKDTVLELLGADGASVWMMGRPLARGRHTFGGGQGTLRDCGREGAGAARASRWARP